MFCAKKVGYFNKLNGISKQSLEYKKMEAQLDIDLDNCLGKNSDSYDNALELFSK